MSQGTRKREPLAPALFPFLAVLLCTVGSLIVILVLSVFHAQASARSEVTNNEEELTIVSDEIELASQEFEDRREAIQEELKKQRGELAHYEDHISRLVEELKSLQDKHKALLEESKHEAAKMTAEEIAFAKKRVADAEQELQAKVEELKQRPPAFAILPYGGPNGTTRRPIYLECTKEGVMIQPEGILISMKELMPPHGPGNPLDAALRLIRTEYERVALATSEGSAPYPLLLVRPDGIKTYALARNAMGGWDDQFGYELISADMPLAFPPGVPGIAPKLTEVLQAAKNRQQALIAAMPAKYANMEFDDLEPLTGGSNELGIGSNAGKDWDDGPLQGTTQEGTGWKVVQELPLGGNGPYQGSGTGNGNRSGGPSPGGRSVASTPSGFASGGSGGGGGSFGGNGSMGGYGNDLAGGTAGGGEDSWNSSASGPGGSGPGGSSGNSANTMPGGASGQGGASGNASRGGGASLTQGSDDPISRTFGSNADSSENRNALSGSSNGSTSSSSPSNRSTSTNGSNNTVQAAPGLQFQGGSSSSGASNSGSPTDSGNVEAGIGYQGRPTVTDPNNAPTKTSPQSSDRRESKNSKSKDDSKPIAATRGRGWAEVRAGSVKNTPVVRVIHMHVYPDSWQMLNEFDPKKVDTKIDLQEGPQVASTKLADGIRERVESWGVAVARGYWKPKLIIRVMPNSETSLRRLERLLEGSGVEIQIQREL